MTAFIPNGLNHEPFGGVIHFSDKNKDNKTDNRFMIKIQYNFIFVEMIPITIMNKHVTKNANTEPFTNEVSMQ